MLSRGGNRLGQSQILDRALAHPVLLDLARHRHRERVDEPNVGGDLVGRDLAPAELADLVLGRLLPGVQLDPRADRLPVLRVGHADHLHVGDLRVREEELLDLPRVHVLAAADDHVLQPADDADRAVVAHLGQVPGAQPARRVDRAARLVRLLPVPTHHQVAADAELALASAREHRAVGRVGHLRLDPWMHVANGRHAELQCVVGHRLERHGRGLGHAVADRHLAGVHPVDHLAHHLDRAGGAGHHPGAQAREVVPREPGVLEHRDEHRGHAVDTGAPLGLDRGETLAGVERLPRQHHGRAVGEAGEVAQHHPEAVIEGHRHTDAIGRRVPEARADHRSVVEHVVVGEGRPLRRARGPRRELDVDRVVGVQRRLAVAQRLGRDGGRGVDERVPGERPARQVALPQQHDRAEQREPGTLVVEHRDVVGRMEPARRDQDGDPGGRHRMTELVATVRGVHVHEDRADLRGGVLGDRPLDAVRAPDPHAVALRDAQREERASRAFDLGVQRRIGEPDPLVPRDDRLGLGARRRREVELRPDRPAEQRTVGRSRHVRGIWDLLHLPI